MIGVDVRVDDDVDGLQGDFGALQRVQKVGVEVIQRRHRRAVAIVADAGVHQHRQAVHLDPGKERQR